MTTRTLVVKLRKQSPCYPLSRIADKVGVSRESVRQILKSENLPTKHYTVTYHCAECGSLLHYRNRTGGLCKPCRHNKTLVPITCDTCGKLFYRYSTQVLNSRQPHTGYYCSQKCYGKILGKNSGFGKHPENAGCCHKYDYSIIWNKYTIDKLNGWQIHNQLNIPPATVYVILNSIKSLPTQEAVDKFIKEHTLPAKS